MAHIVHITVRALREIDEALKWRAKTSSTAARRWLERLMAAIQSLKDSPERYGLAPESDWFPGEIRQLLHGKKGRTYRILFEIRGATVFILRVRHGAQALLEPGEL